MYYMLEIFFSGTIAWNNRLYSFGGVFNDDWKSWCYAYDPILKCCKELKNLDSYLFPHACIVLKSGEDDDIEGDR